MFGLSSVSPLPHSPEEWKMPEQFNYQKIVYRVGLSLQLVRWCVVPEDCAPGGS